MLEELDPRYDATEETDEPHTPDHLNVEAIKRKVQQLPDGYRVVLSLYLFEGYDHQEIGEILGITEATSKSQYSRARKKLRALLESAGGASGE
jgi:RNA polymerase sigma-70 factor (ECF subfamily)